MRAQLWRYAVAVLASGLLVALPAGALAAGPATEFSAGITPTSIPHGIAAGPDGNLWFTEIDGDRIGRITPAGVVTEFSAGITADARPKGIAAGPDGNLWFTEYDGDRIGRITPAGTVTEFTAGITPGADPGRHHRRPGRQPLVHRVRRQPDRADHPRRRRHRVRAGITAGAGPRGITAGPDGNLWFTEYDGDRIGRITPAGVVTEFSAGITAGAGPRGIAAGPDGNLWFTEFAGDRIGRITPPAPSPSSARASPRAASPTRSPPGRTATSGSPSRRQPDRADHPGRHRHRVQRGHHVRLRARGITAGPRRQPLVRRGRRQPDRADRHRRAGAHDRQPAPQPRLRDRHADELGDGGGAGAGLGGNAEPDVTRLRQRRALPVDRRGDRDRGRQRTRLRRPQQRGVAGDPAVDVGATRPRSTRAARPRTCRPSSAGRAAMRMPQP